jgi:ring-1,2-phenylacetyl-CoA epoxidase subunit PaaD
MVTKEAVVRALEMVPDPEMPISIVELGLLDDVRIRAAAPQEAFAAPESPRPGAAIEIDLIPTFLGCPALEIIERNVRQTIGTLTGVAEVKVSWKFSPPWTPDRISPAGRRRLAAVGISAPRPGVRGPTHAAAIPQLVHLSQSEPKVRQSPTPAVECPFCGSPRTTLESPFGPTRCKMIFHCDSCKNVFEHIKRI